MTAGIEALLRDLQGAVSVRRLYPPGHPRLVALVDQVVADAADATSVQREVAAFCLDGRVVSGGEPLPSGEAIAKGIFATIGEHGFHCITVRRGLSAQEVASFVEAAASAERAGGKPTLRSSPHLGLSAHVAEPATSSGAQPSVSAEHHDKLSQVWEGVMRRREFDLDAMEFTLLALARTLSDSIGAAIPLATLKSHDDYTVTHIVNVALLSMAFAEAIGLPPALVKDVGVSALLHDVGKLHVPAAVLNESGSLNDAQRSVIRRHPEHGARMLLATPGVPELAVTVAYEHHLQYDGGGYPTVPRSWKMSLASEVTHIADVFDALRSNRPYRAALAHDRVVELMLRDGGTVFDPSLVQTFVDLVVPRTAAHPPA